MAGNSGSVVDQIFIALGLDTKDLEKGIDGAVNKVTSGLKNLFTTAIAPTLAAVASGQFVAQVSEEITQIDRLSKSLGINMEDLQAWQGSAEMAGIAAGKVGDLFTNLNERIIDADQNQGGGLYKYIEKGLLPAVRDAKGELKSTEQYAMELSDALASMDEQTASGIGKQIGIGDAGIVAWLQQGSSTINGQMQHVKQLGVYTKEDAKVAKEFKGALNDLGRAATMMFLPIFRAIAPIATKVAEKISYLSQHVEMFIPVLAALGIVLGADVVKSLYAAAKAAIAFSKSFLLSPLGLVMAALVGLGLLLDDLITWTKGGESALGEYWQAIFGSIESAQKVFDEFYSHFVQIWDGAVSVFNGAISAIGHGIGALISLIQALINTFIALVTGSEEAWSRAIAAFSAFKQHFADIVDNIIGMAKGMWDTIKGIFGSVKDLLSWSGKTAVSLAIGDKGQSNSTTDNSQHSTVIKQTNNFQNVSDPQAAAEAVGNATADITANANTAYT